MIVFTQARSAFVALALGACAPPPSSTVSAKAQRGEAFSAALRRELVRAPELFWPPATELLPALVTRDRARFVPGRAPS